MFFVFPKINAEHIPKAAVNNKYKIAETIPSFQTKNAIGICTTVQIKELATFAAHSSFKANDNLPKMYPLNEISSEKAVANERPKLERSGKLPILEAMLRWPYLKRFVSKASIIKIVPKPNERKIDGNKFLKVIPNEDNENFSFVFINKIGAIQTIGFITNSSIVSGS